MTDMYFLVLTAINLFALAFMCVLVSLNDTLNPKQTRGFLYTFLLIALISILELITVLVDRGPRWMRPINIISNYLGFSLTPAVPLVMVYTIDQSGQISESLKVATALEIVYFLIMTVSLFTGGLVFTVDAMNHYSRLGGFPVYMLMYYAGIVFLMYHLLEMARFFQNRGRELIYALALFLALGTLVQIRLPGIHVTWLCVTILSILYYLYCNEMWNQLDGLTGLLSQKNYLNRTLNLHEEDRMLIVLDLDDFKHINDTYGHLAGDRCLREIAQCLKKAYSRYGNCYRIGGDEFCVLLWNPEKEVFCREKFYWNLTKQRVKTSILPNVSYGSALLDAYESIRDTKARADQKMYQNKKEHKAEKHYS